MNAAAAHTAPAPARGTSLLLDHCSLVGRLTGPGRASARERLERRVGQDLARVLVRGLSGDHRVRPLLLLRLR